MKVLVLTMGYFTAIFYFCSQPKDTQQALSRKASAVNMEKFKKFAARRKWKVSYSINLHNAGNV